MLGLVEIIGNDSEMTPLHLAAFDLLRSLGRAKLAKKRIIRECLNQNKITFHERVSKQFLLCYKEEN